MLAACEQDPEVGIDRCALLLQVSYIILRSHVALC
jgi:hypothetical protein